MKQSIPGHPTPLRRGERAAEALHRMLAEQFDIVLDNVPIARRGSVQALHDLRVALRRMRTLAAVFDPVDPSFLRSLDRRAAKECDRMGDARDLDVWIALFGDLEKAGGLKGMPRGDRQGVVQELQRERTRLAARALSGSTFKRIQRMLWEYLRQPAQSRPRPSPPPDVLAARRILVVRKKIAKRHAQAGRYSSRPAHALRRSGRRMRYLSEFFAPQMGPAAQRAGRWITKAQAALGKVHDCDNALELSRELPGNHARAEVRRGLKKRRVAQLAKFKAAWQHYADPRLQQAWLKQLETLAAHSG